jgi:superfamily II DNA or RNA helicase
MNAVIIDNNWIYLENITEYEDNTLFHAFSVAKPGIYIDPSQLGQWDGIFRKYNRAKKRLTRPFLSMLINVCEKHNLPLTIDDRREEWKYSVVPQEEIGPDFLPGITLATYQIKAIRKGALDGCECGIYDIPTGGGKCLGYNTPVLMHDMTVKMVQDIVRGDLLMGDDGTPRTVLSTCSGVDNLYSIKQKNGDDYVVNEAHILSLMRTPDGKSKSKDYMVYDIPITEYLASSVTRKHLLKGYKANLDIEESPCGFDPYAFGVWLGDGVSADCTFVLNETTDQPIVEYLKSLATTLTMELVKYQEPTQRYDYYSLRLYEGVHKPDHIPTFTVNPFRQFLKSRNLFGNKHVPLEFIRNSRNVRLKVLAGFLDADGYTNERNDMLYATIKNTKLVPDITLLARSLGFKVTVSDCWKTYDGINGDWYKRITISGHLDSIPLLVTHKLAKPRLMKKNPLVCGIKVESIGHGQYFGFELDGNKRFLLGDLTVTHNTEIISGLCKAISCPTIVLADQTVVIDQIKERLELRKVAEEIGLFYAGKRPNGQAIVIGSVSSLTYPSKAPLCPDRNSQEDEEAYQKKLAKWEISLKGYKTRKKNAKALLQYVKKAEMIIVDECDLATSDLYKGIFRYHFAGRKRFGFSGTVFDPSKPVEAMDLQERLGSVIFNISRQKLTELGRIIPCEYRMLVHGLDGSIKEASAYDIATNDLIVESKSYHELLLMTCKYLNQGDDGTLLLVDRERLAEQMVEILNANGLKAEMALGKTPKKKRNDIFERFQNREINFLVGGKIINRGFDLKGGCENLIIATGGKMQSKILQILGRALRRNKQGKSFIYDVLFRNNKYLYDHGKQRLKIIDAAGYKTSVIFPNGHIIDGRDFINSKFRITKTCLQGKLSFV